MTNFVPQSQPGFPPPNTPRAKRRAGLPVLAAGLVVVAVIGGVRGVQLHNDAKADSTPSSSPTATSSAGTPGVLASGADATLAKQLSYEIQTHNRSAFLSHMVGKGRPAAERWWNNWDAIGFDYGSVALPAKPNDIGEGKTATIGLDIGMHNTLSPVVKGDSDGVTQLALPSTRYQLTLQAQAHSTSPLITSWQGMSNAPWDDSAPMYVVHTAHTVTAGPADQRSFIKAESKVAETSATWLLKFLGEYKGFVQQKGFIDFVSAKPSDRARWFSTSAKPRGWLADPHQVGGFFKPLPAIPSDGDQKISALACAGGYVVLGLKINVPAVNNVGLVAHEFAHDLMAVNDLWSFGSGKPLPAWVVEGFARWVEAFYHNTPGNPLKKDAQSGPYLALGLKAAGHPIFAGRPPSDSQIYGNGALANYYYDLSATTFQYMAKTYGASAGFHSALIAYIGGSDGPFASVLKSSSHGTLVFEDPAKIEAGWSRFYVQTYGR